MANYQAGILQDLPRHARYLSFEILHDATPEHLRAALLDLQDYADGESMVIGIGSSVLSMLGVTIKGMRNLPVMSGVGLDIPSTPAALWCWLRGEDRGELLHRARQLEQGLFSAFTLTHVLDGFLYAGGRDLSGYEDGTENPQGDEALAAAIVSGQGRGMDGSSFVAVQQWLHDLDVFEDKSVEEQDDMIGRHIHDNEEFDEAPESAHVKRTAQESFTPAAFMLRRSTPWVDGSDAGLNFVAFGKSFAAFEAVLNRMVGGEDGVSDALFTFTRPVNGAYYWCPPMQAGRLDLSILGL